MVATQIEARGVRDARVLDAMRRVERHRFVPESMRDHAYEDHPLGIGYGQTISQPYIVAVMTEAARVRPGARVLEIGAGSGYQAAVLAELAGEVDTIELIEPLAKDVAARLSALGYRNVNVRAGDGYHGWPERAPFDAIVVAAGPAGDPATIARPAGDWRPAGGAGRRGGAGAGGGEADGGGPDQADPSPGPLRPDDRGGTEAPLSSPRL